MQKRIVAGFVLVLAFFSTGIVTLLACSLFTGIGIVICSLSLRHFTISIEYFDLVRAFGFLPKRQMILVEHPTTTKLFYVCRCKNCIFWMS